MKAQDRPRPRAAARALAALALAASIGATGAVATACGSRTSEPDHPLIDVDDPQVSGRSSAREAEGEEPRAKAQASEAGAGDSPRAAPAGVSGPRRRSGQLDRGALDRVLAAGPGRFLHRVEVKAHLVGGEFRGWQVVRTPFDDIDLVPGDIVLEVNGHTLEHPLELKVLWDELARADAIAVSVERDGDRFGLRFAVVPGAPARVPAKRAP
jgi:hypothetical protein